VQNNVPRRSRKATLPSPKELAARISEAKTSADLLVQFIQSMPAIEVPSNELVKEFSDRCRGATISVQEYMQCDDPPPDDETLLTLIETNDKISAALSKYQRALLNGRQAQTNGSEVSHDSSSGGPPVTTAELPVPAQRALGLKADSPVSPTQAPGKTPSVSTRSGNSRYQYNPEEFQVQNPFADSKNGQPELPAGRNRENVKKSFQLFSDETNGGSR
jgi:GAT domain